MGGQVCLDHRHQVRRDGHVAGTGVTLGSTRRVTEVAAEIRMNEANIQKWTATLDPGMIVLGGSFVPLGELIVPAVEEAVAKGFAGGGGFCFAGSFEHLVHSSTPDLKVGPTGLSSPCVGR